MHPTAESEQRKHKLKRLVQSPNSYFMDVKCPGCFNITTVFSHVCLAFCVHPIPPQLPSHIFNHNYSRLMRIIITNWCMYRPKLSCCADLAPQSFANPLEGVLVSRRDAASARRLIKELITIVPLCSLVA